MLCRSPEIGIVEPRTLLAISSVKFFESVEWVEQREIDRVSSSCERLQVQLAIPDFSFFLLGGFLRPQGLALDGPQKGASGILLMGACPSRRQ